MWVKILLACVLVALCYSCAPPDPNMDFTDFAKRSQILVVAQLTTKSTLQVNFKVTKVFSKKTGFLKLGKVIPIKWATSKCIRFVPMETGVKYVLFLQKLPGNAGFKMQFRPVKSSHRNFLLFDSVLKGTAKPGTSLEISGCAKIPAPMNGFVTCSKTRTVCTLSCKTGFTLEGGATRTCVQTTGLWAPKEIIQCVANKPATTTTTTQATTTTATTTVATTTSAPATPTEGFASITLNEAPTTQDSELQRLAALWRNQQISSMAAMKTTEKPVAIKEIKTTTTTSTPLQTTTTKAPWFRFASHPPAILKLGAAPPRAHDTGAPAAPPNEADIKVVGGVAIDPNGTPDSFQDPHNQTNTPMLAPDNRIYGCPSYEIPIHMYATWHGGFNGKVEFPKLPHQINGGWLVCLKFNDNLDDLKPYNGDVDVLSINKKHVCLRPSYYNQVLYVNQDLFIGFIGHTDLSKPSSLITGTGTLMGWCHQSLLSGKVAGTIFDTPVIRAFKNDTNTTAPMFTQHTDFATATTQPPLIANPGGVGSTSPPLPTKAPTTTKQKWTPRTTTKKKWTPTTKKKWTPRTTTKKKWTPKRPAPGFRGNLRRAPLNSLSSWPAQRCNAATPNGKVAKGGNLDPRSKVSKNKLLATDINYDDVLYKSNLFYEAQRSGMLHTSNRIPWRSHSALKDGCDIVANLTGGWYNDEGHVKSTYPIAFAATMLSWGVVDFRDAYIQSGELLNAMSNIKWAAKYLLQCHIGEERLVGQVGNYVRDKSDWGRAEELEVSERIVYVLDKNNPSPEIVAETVAALSAASLVFKLRDPAFSSKCITHAKQLFEFAEKYPAGTVQAIPTSRTKYSPWNGPNDDLAWAAAWLARATQSEYFLDKAESYYAAIDGTRRPSRLFYWDDKTNGVAVLLARLTKQQKYKDDIKTYVNNVIDTAYRTPSKSIYLSDQAPNQHTGNAMFIALTSLPYFSSPIRRKQIKSFASKQVGLLLGSSGRSFMVGCGTNPPRRPYHMGSSCPDYPAKCTADVLLTDEDNPHILYGALVAGADKNGGYEDSIYMPSYNQVSVVINSGFQSAVAALKYYEVVEYKKRKFTPKVTAGVNKRRRKKSG